MAKDNSNFKPWAGRFKEKTNSLVELFTESVSYDNRLYEQDIRGSIAHAKMLAKQGIITEDERDKIIKGLIEIRDEIRSGKFKWDISLEDVHMNIERALFEKIGDAGKKLHTARSRNDQIATDIRLYLRDEIDELDNLLKALQESFLSQAERYFDLIIPGFTHLQHAQPVLWSHHMLSYFEMFKRDRQRLFDCRKRVNICPLGSAALAGTDFPIDRYFVAKELGFDDITKNSMDAVSDRDFIVEFLAATSIIMLHLSRICEELIMWTSTEFNLIELPDAFCTGSSIMPQKKNPDVAELVRGKSARVIGSLISLLTLIKSLPLCYNRDMQEDKEPLFDAIDTTKNSVKIMAELVKNIKPNHKRAKELVQQGFLTATDLADYLVQKGIPFRDAHEIVGKAVAYAIENNKNLEELTLEELKSFCPKIEEDVFKILTIEGSVNARNCPGGTAPSEVKKAIEEAKKYLGIST